MKKLIEAIMVICMCASLIVPTVSRGTTVPPINMQPPYSNPFPDPGPEAPDDPTTPVDTTMSPCDQCYAQYNLDETKARNTLKHCNHTVAYGALIAGAGCILLGIWNGAVIPCLITVASAEAAGLVKCDQDFQAADENATAALNDCLGRNGCNPT